MSRCLSKDPKQRYADVAELARALAPFASGALAIYAERCSFLLPRDGEQRGRVPDMRRVHLHGKDPNRTVPAIIRNEPPGSGALGSAVGAAEVRLVGGGGRSWAPH